ncbi:hypothetical protein [Octadecabacter ascidiaceicola]|nr:hypothetical protein [Octadecabacter ascidiaceicola]
MILRGALFPSNVAISMGVEPNATCLSFDTFQLFLTVFIGIDCSDGFCQVLRMEHQSPPRGGAAVGHLGELNAIEAGAVIYWRLWSTGIDGQRRTHADFSRVLGEKPGFEAVDALAQIFDLCVRHGRRPLMRHDLDCKCLGADESCIANFIGYASECKREDAALIASLIVKPDLCLPMAALAQTFGLALRRMALAELPRGAPNIAAETHSTSKTIH